MVGEDCGCFQFLAFTISTTMDILYVFWWTSVYISVEYAAVCRVAESGHSCMWSAVVDTDKQLAKVVMPVYIPTSSEWLF